MQFELNTGKFSKKNSSKYIDEVVADIVCSQQKIERILASTHEWSVNTKKEYDDWWRKIKQGAIQRYKNIIRKQRSSSEKHLKEAS